MNLMGYSLTWRSLVGQEAAFALLCSAMGLVLFVSWEAGGYLCPDLARQDHDNKN